VRPVFPLSRLPRPWLWSASLCERPDERFPKRCLWLLARLGLLLSRCLSARRCPADQQSSAPSPESRSRRGRGPFAWNQPSLQRAAIPSPPPPSWRRNCRRCAHSPPRMVDGPKAPPERHGPAASVVSRPRPPRVTLRPLTGSSPEASPHHGSLADLTTALDVPLSSRLSVCRSHHGSLFRTQRGSR